ncbi:hypothetical protein GPJ56_001010 [Histomonas meleagridis]|uniref:uncharacterized protein n=1 Tax=Histomonas meleagridis TaxID=135588 RepID=UPI0035599E2D|nr:hypothetical protein GPJ56_001010 [Histomonas meleagridis]KAH0804677.1 hypothetical protein GO595_002542 [Histomonas meleagridis]
MKADAASRTKDNLDLNHNRLQIKKDLLNILNQIKQMKLEVQKQRNAIEKRIQDTKERIKKLLQNAFEEGSKILTEKQKQVNKQQAELNRMNQEMQETMQNLKTNIDRIEKKFLSSPDESPQDPNKLLIDIDALADGKIEPKNLTQEFNLKLNDFEIRIDKTIQKVIETSETIQKDEEFEKLKRAIQRQYQIKENFKMLLRIGRKAALTQGILKKMTAMSMETSKIITQQIQLENTNPGAKVADTNLTFPEMRKAIIAMK